MSRQTDYKVKITTLSYSRVVKWTINDINDTFILSDGVSNGSDKTLAHMSMATRQYLEKHHLIGTPQVAGRLSKEDYNGEASDSERILDVQRLKTLPKLI